MGQGHWVLEQSNNTALHVADLFSLSSIPYVITPLSDF